MVEGLSTTNNDGLPSVNGCCIFIGTFIIYYDCGNKLEIQILLLRENTISVLVTTSCSFICCQ